MPNVEELELREPGFITVHNASGPPIKYPIADLLRAADIPALTQTQVVALKALANLEVILIRTLIEKEVLDETFADSLGMDWGLEHLIYAVEQLGGSYAIPHFDDVEDA